MNKKFACVILAAGEGTRMKSAIPKVLHKICGQPMVEYVLALADKLKINKILVVVGHKKDQLKELIDKYKVRQIHQDKLLGTGDALKRTYGILKSFHGHCLVLYGDQPLIREQVLKDLMKKHIATNAQATVLTAYVENPFGYGRIVRDNFSRITSIIEERDASDEQKGINEINTGIICFKNDSLFNALKKIRPDNAKKEYYLTDVIKIMSQEGLTVESFSISSDIEQAQGINTLQDLAYAQKIMRRRILAEFMDNGVNIIDPETTHIDCDCKIGEDTVVYPFTVIEKGVIIGKLCNIGPFCHLRSGTIIKDKVKVGNFTEIARSSVQANTLMEHFGFLEDAVVAGGSNISGGTVVIGSDGKPKHKTFIGKENGDK